MLCLFSANVSAAPIDVEQARQVVEKFRKKATRGGMRRAPMAKGRLNHCYTKRTQAGNPAVYAFTNEGGGFALVAADDAVTSVLGYSDTGTFDPDNIPDGLQYLLDEYAKEIASAGPRKANEEMPYVPQDAAPIGPLVKTKWGQLKCYNRYCPFALTNADGNGCCATGCMTTAIAQIMKYYEWPVKGKGSAYQDARQMNYSEPTVPYVQDYYSHTYRWDLMHNTTSEYPKNSNGVYSLASPDVQAVSQLMIDVAVALRTEFWQVSGAVDVAIKPALTSYFDYDPSFELVKKADYSWEDFNAIIIEELQAGRPVYMEGGGMSGHAFICDGYDGEGRFHINWGWEGTSDGDYVLSSLWPSQVGTGGDASIGYSKDLTIGRNFKPYSGAMPMPRPEFIINYKSESDPGYSVIKSGTSNYRFAATFGGTRERNIRGKLGMLIVDASGLPQIVWNQDEEYTQILYQGTEGAYYDFRVDINPLWLEPGTRAYYIYKECGDDDWHYVKDNRGKYCCFVISLENGEVVFRRDPSTPTENTVTTHTFELGNLVTDEAQIQSGHVYAIVRKVGAGYATYDINSGALKGAATFDTAGTNSFVFTGDATNGYTIKSAIANAYLPVLQTDAGNGRTVTLGTVQEKFKIVDVIDADYSTGVQIKSLNSTYNTGTGTVFLHCTGPTNPFLGWHNQTGDNTQMLLYEVLVDGEKTMPNVTPTTLVVTYNIIHDGVKIGEKKYEETIGEAPVADFIPDFVAASDFPTVISADKKSYDIHTTYTTDMPFEPGTKVYNVRFVQNGTSYWWTHDGSAVNGQVTTSTPQASDKKSQWVFQGDWVNGFTIHNGNFLSKMVFAQNLSDNNVATYMAVDPSYGPHTFMLEHSSSGFIFHLKGGSAYLAYLPSLNGKISLSNTQNNPAALVYFAVPGEDPTTPDTPVDPVDPDTPDEPTGTYSLGDRVANIADIVSGELYAIVRHAGAGYATFDASTGKVSGKETYPTDGTAAFVFTGDNTNGYTIKSALTNAYFPVLTTTDGNGTPVVLGSNPEKYIIKDHDSNIGTGVQIASKSSSYTGTGAFDGGSSNVYLNSGDTTRDFVGYWKKNGGNTQMDIYKVNYNGGETPVDPTPELHTYTVNVVGAPTGQTVTVTVKGQTVTGTSVTLDSTVSATDVSATAISGYTYSVEVNGTTITVTYESDNTPTGPDFTVPGTYYVYIQKGTKYLHNDRLNNISNTTEEVEVQSLNTEDNGFVWRLTTHGTTYDLVNGQGFGYKQYATSSEQKTLTSIPDTWTLTSIPESKIWNVVVEGSEYGCVTRGDYCVAWDGGFFVTDMTASADAFAAGEVDGCTAAPLSITDGTSAATITVTYTPNGISQDILDLIEEVKAANVKMQTGTVGYPLIADLNRSDTDLAAYFTFLDAQGDLPDATPEFYEELRASFEHLAATYTDVKMPEAGHAYKISVRSNDGNTHWYIKNNGKITTNADEAAIFVMGGSGNEDFSAIFVSNDNGNSHYLRSRGADAVNYVADKCDFRLTPMTKVSSSFITVNVLRRFGTFSFRPKSDVMMGGQYPMTLDESNLDWAFATKEVMGEACTSAIEMTEVEYPYTKPKLVAGDNGSFASIWLPFPMIFPEGVEVYKGTQEHGADGSTFLGLERVDTNRAVAAGGYILYSETLTGEIEVQPVAGTPADKHNTSDAAFFGSTEPNYTWSEFTTAHPGTPYVLANKDKGIGFYKYVGTTLPKGKAIWMDPNGTASTVKFNFDDVITALDALHGHQSPFKEDLEGLYDLQGHRLDKVQKGQVNVINGKKIMFK